MKSVLKLLLPFLLLNFHCWADFISYPSGWIKFNKKKDAIVIASPGRSGSTVLYESLLRTNNDLFLIKTHLLPPKEFKGKILFIYSNPDLASESVLYRIYHDRPSWGIEHFRNVFTSDKEWINTLNGSYTNQTLDNNLLCYDALGIEAHLRIWLQEYTTPSTRDKANILAIKYENLWNLSTKLAIMQFLNLNHLTLPEKKERGYDIEKLTPEEIAFRDAYNLGTPEHPIYAAYDGAREIWENSPPFEYLQFGD